RVPSQIFFRDDPAPSPLVGHERVGDRAFIESLRSLRRDQLERTSEIGLREPSARRERVPSRTEEILSLEASDERVAVPFPCSTAAAPATSAVILGSGHHATLFRQPNRRPRHLVPQYH